MSAVTPMDRLPILASAYRHGCTDEQIRHALRVILDVYEEQGDLELYMVIGAGPSGEVLEVGIMDEPEGLPGRGIVHAQPARRKYWP